MGTSSAKADSETVNPDARRAIDDLIGLLVDGRYDDVALFDTSLPTISEWEPKDAFV
jgi:hypothetical protein